MSTPERPPTDMPIGPEPCCFGSHTEWDPLEEVIVGVIDGAAVPEWHVTLRATMPESSERLFRTQGGRPFPAEAVSAARRDLEGLVELLKSEGVRVHRPDVHDHTRPFSTPDWSSKGGLYAAMPRDLLLVLGDELIEAPLAWRSRYVEIHCYRRLLKEFFQRGARWTAAPKPMLRDALYDQHFVDPAPDGPMRYVVTDEEPVFDAADFVRCGQDLFFQLSNVTNRFGVQWLQRHVGSRYRFHELQVRDTHPMHIDATFMPLAPGKVLVNPDRLPALPAMFRDWEVLTAPAPCLPDHVELYMSSKWISMNILMLDEKRVLVEKHETDLIAAFKRWGFQPIPCHFLDFNRFGGSFHCATLDVVRRGGLQTYF
jgi:glycine amidinotransferase